VWLLVGLLPLLWWPASRRESGLALLFLALSVVASVPSQGDTRWSPYQKLVGRPASIAGPSGELADGYLVQVSDVFY
jgi:hypothetical protein